MKCDVCKKDFEEKNIHESHDVPCYLFEGIGTKERLRRSRKNQADKLGRHHLCDSCHKEYENGLRLFLQKKAKEFSNDYFQSIVEGDNGLLR